MKIVCKSIIISLFALITVILATCGGCGGGGGGGTVQLPPNGLFLNSDNLLTAPLSSASFLTDNTMTGPTSDTNNIGSATFTASPPDVTARNIGLQFVAATQMNTLDVWVYSVTGATIDTAVPAFLPATVAGAFMWAVYTSSDGSNWRLFQTGAPAPYVLDVSRPGVGRFEITFPNVVTKYIKVVVSPLSPFAAGGQAGDFPGIYVTELQAFNTTPAASINKDATKDAFGPQSTVFNTKLYATWFEISDTANQVRTVVAQVVCAA